MFRLMFTMFHPLRVCARRVRVYSRAADCRNIQQSHHGRVIFPLRIRSIQSPSRIDFRDFRDFRQRIVCMTLSTSLSNTDIRIRGGREGM